MTLLHTLLLSLVALLSGCYDEAEIVFAGDAMQHQGQLDAARRNGGEYDYSECFASVQSYIEDADYAVVNLETPLGESNFTGYPCFNAPESYAQALYAAGFDMMLTANNHCLDRRDKGVRTTLDILDRNHIPHVGTYRNQAERDSLITEIVNIKGFKVAFLNYTYGTNGIAIQGNVVVDYIDRELIAKDVERVRAAGAEIITACIHWGNEYQLLPHQSQKSLADYLCNLGVDLIIGGHPHVIQPMEMRYSEKYSKNILLVYSLGNFISNMKTRDTRGGAMVKVSLYRDADGDARIAMPSYRLVFTVPSGSGKNYRLVPVENLTEGAWSTQCKAFTQAAEAIFKKHNRGVPRDTTKIVTKKAIFDAKK